MSARARCSTGSPVGELALVADTPGVTRDRKEAEALLRGRRVRLVDTAGLEEAPPETLAGRMRVGAGCRDRGADLVLFVVDARTGRDAGGPALCPVAASTGRQVLLVANKAEGPFDAVLGAGCVRLGLGEPIAVSAEHGEGISDLMAEIADRLPDEDRASRRGDAERPAEAGDRRAAECRQVDPAEPIGRSTSGC